MAAFEPGLPAARAHANLREALADLRRAERNAVLWFAEIMQRRLYRELSYSTILHYATGALGFSRSKAYHFIQLAQRLEALPRLRDSLERGELGWTQARELVKVATPRSEARWLDAARGASSRELAKQVRAARDSAGVRRAAAVGQGDLLAACAQTPSGGGEHRGALPDEPSLETATAPDVTDSFLRATKVDQPVALTLRLDALRLARLEALIEKLRRTLPAGERRQSREDLLLAGLDALLTQAQRRADTAPPAGTPRVAEPNGAAEEEKSTRVDFSSPYQIVIYKCERCRDGAVKSSRGDLPLSRVALQAAECDARILPQENPAGLAAQSGAGDDKAAPAAGDEGSKLMATRSRAAIPPAMRRRVLARDRHSCRAPGCGATRFLEVHHIKPRSRGGLNRPENLITLCGACHRLLHEQGSGGGSLGRLLAGIAAGSAASAG